MSPPLLGVTDTTSSFTSSYLEDTWALMASTGTVEVEANRVVCCSVWNMVWNDNKHGHQTGLFTEWRLGDRLLLSNVACVCTIILTCLGLILLYIPSIFLSNDYLSLFQICGTVHGGYTTTTMPNWQKLYCTLCFRSSSAFPLICLTPESGSQAAYMHHINMSVNPPLYFFSPSIYPYCYR